MAALFETGLEPLLEKVARLNRWNGLRTPAGAPQPAVARSIAAPTPAAAPPAGPGFMRRMIGPLGWTAAAAAAATTGGKLYAEHERNQQDVANDGIVYAPMQGVA